MIYLSHVFGVAFRSHHHNLVGYDTSNPPTNRKLIVVWEKLTAV